MPKTKTLPKMAILPREPLTKKARAAIGVYAILTARRQSQERVDLIDARVSGEICLDDHGYYMTTRVVNATLEAERMRRTDVYIWLEKRGYRWHANPGRWIKMERTKPNGHAS